MLAADWRDLDDRVGELEETAARSGSRPLLLNIYAQAHIYDPTVVGFPCTFDTDPKVCGGDPSQTTKLPAASWQGVVIGARIQF